MIVPLHCFLLQDAFDATKLMGDYWFLNRRLHKHFFLNTFHLISIGFLSGMRVHNPKNAVEQTPFLFYFFNFFFSPGSSDSSFQRCTCTLSFSWPLAWHRLRSNLKKSYH